MELKVFAGEDHIHRNSVSTTKNSIILGRAEITGVEDKRCSREHTKIELDYDSEEIVVNQVGSNASYLKYKGTSLELVRHTVHRIPFKLCNVSNPVHLWLLSKPIHQHLFNFYLAEEKSSHCTTNNGAVKLSIETEDPPHDDLKPVKRKIDGTLNSFVTNKRVKTNQGGAWTEQHTLVYMYESESIMHSEKIAAFDMDTTLIVPASGGKWPKSKDDWKFMWPEIPKKIRETHSAGYKIVILTNQAGIVKRTTKAVDIQHKIESMVVKLEVPAQAIIAGDNKGACRKPAIGMWSLIEKRNGGKPISLRDSFYVGDAAGRVAKWAPGKKKDFSNSDRLFALNLGLPFHTPEAFFQGMKEGAFTMPEFIPKDSIKVTSLIEPPSANLKSAGQEVIVMVGYPGSGKSAFAKGPLMDYVRINRDELGTWQKCVAKLDDTLKEGKSAVVDNTNPDRESRARYVDVAKKHKVNARCFLMTTSYKQSRHNEKYRQLTEPKHKPINDMVVNSYKSKYEEPNRSEGFVEVVQANFVPKFDSEVNKKLYMSFLLDK